jgi:hypothetical protein
MSTGGLDIGRRAASLRRMQSSSKEDPSHPGKKVVEVPLDTGNIWFRQVEGSLPRGVDRLGGKVSGSGFRAVSGRSSHRRCDRRGTAAQIVLK